MRKTAVVLLSLGTSLLLSPSAHAGLLHDVVAADHGVKKLEHADNKLSAMEHDVAKVEHKLGIPSIRKIEKIGRDVVPGDKSKHHEGEKLLRDAEKARNFERRKKKNECLMAHIMFFFRHPPGTGKPENVHGVGCHMWKEDAAWHERHPAVLRLFGKALNFAF